MPLLSAAIAALDEQSLDCCFSHEVSERFTPSLLDTKKGGEPRLLNHYVNSR